MEPSSPPPPRSPPPNKRGIPNSGTNYWSIFSQGQTDMFASPQRRSATSTPTRWKNRVHDGNSTIQSNDDATMNEFTSLLLPSPLRISRDEEVGAQKNANRGIAAASRLAHGFNFSSPHRSLVRGRPQTPLSSSSSKSSKALQPPLLQSMRHWNVALPPLKKHVVDGKLVDTFRGSLYGNDRKRSLPVAKRRLTIELFGHDHDTKLWGNRKRRNFSDLEKNRYCASGGSSCGGVSRLSDPSWALLKGASSDDLSIAKADWQSDTDSSGNDVDNAGSRNYQLAERDIVVLRVMKSRVVTQYDDEFGLGDSSINSGLRDRKWESQSMSDKTMSWMVGLETGDGDHAGDDNSSFSSRESLMKKHVRWTELSRTRLSHVELVREDFEANEVDLKMGVGARTVVQTFRFDDLSPYGTWNEKQEGNARTFSRLFRLLKRLEKERAHGLAAAHRSLLSERGDSSHGKSRGQESSTSGSHHGNGNANSDDFHSEGENEEADETVSILVEIVSASNLPPAGAITKDNHDGINPHYIGVAEKKDDVFTSDPEAPPAIDPYVVIRDGKRDIHSTSFISDTINPVWTLSSGSLFLLQTDIVEFFDSSNVLEFTVKNHRATTDTEDQTIGTVMVHKTELLDGTGERKCYQILPPPMLPRMKNAAHKTAPTDVETPYLYLRYRQASMEDIEFMRTFQKESKNKSDQNLEGVYASETFLPPQIHFAPLIDQSTEKKDKKNGQSSLYRVKPAPDPENLPETEWMTKPMIDEVSKDHSTSWTMTGSGSTGKLYIEIVGCDGLPQIARAAGEKINPFVNIVFEDSIVNTDVIHDCFSPRWMPWTQRAFVMNMMNLSSQVFVGVFDCKSNHGIGGDNHDPLGRAVINLSSLRPRAIHSLTYNLYDSDDIDRQFRGTISIRLRIAIDNEWKSLVNELSLRDNFHVSTVKESDFRCVAYSLTKDNQPHALNLRSLTNDANELLGYIEQWDQLTGALMVILLWRGHYLATLNLDYLPFSRAFGTARRREIEFNLPIHSMVAFAWATILAWDMKKCFSFLWFTIGWVFLAALENQRRHPSPWRRPRSYIELLRTLLFHKSRISVFGRAPLRRTIHPNERLEEIERFESHKAEQTSARQKYPEIPITGRGQRQTFLQKEKSTVRQGVPKGENHSPESDRTDDSIPIQCTEKHASSDSELDPSEAILFPIQKLLHEICRLLRICSSLFLWKDTFLAFWITSLCFCASFVAFWIPWVWLIQWGLRLFLWPFFGPWMKFVDIYYFQERKNFFQDGEKVVSESETEILVDLYDWLTERKEATAVCDENALKSKDMKRYMFGKYSMRVPVFQEERFLFEPTVSSSSVPYNTNPRPVHIARRIHGQLLKGEMVPYGDYNNSNFGRNGADA